MLAVMPLNSVLLTSIFFSSPTLILSPATLGAVGQGMSFRVDSIILIGIMTNYHHLSKETKS